MQKILMATVAAVNSLGGYEYNPRGNIWLNDDSGLGHKLLMKMGWSKGKGLGKNENGIKENIKVKVKGTSSGVGFKDESFFKVQSTEYDSLLKSISENCAPQNKILENFGETNKQKNGGLEKRSQSFRNRLHYQKFVRGKDLSKYSEKDMKSIFILNKTSEEDKVVPVPEDSVSSLQKGSNPQCTNIVDTYNSSYSISEYFSLKMKGKKNMIPKTCAVNADTQSIHIDPGIPENEDSSVEVVEITSTEQTETPGDGGDESCIDANKELPIGRKEKRKRSKEERSCRNSDKRETNGIEELNSENSSKSIKKRKMSVNSIKSRTSLAHSDIHLSQPAPIECIVLSDCEEDSLKNQKKMKKNKRKGFNMLKSCLKNKSGQYIVKNVSFSEKNSYKMIDSDPDCHPDSLVSCPLEVELESIAHDPESSTVPLEQEVRMHAQVAKSKACLEVKRNENQAKTEISEAQIKAAESESEIKTENSDFLFSSSSKPPFIYNPWIESQKQAKKMKMYKNMFKNIKKHDILKSTNLLFIPGYGNWGF